MLLLTQQYFLHSVHVLSVEQRVTATAAPSLMLSVSFSKKEVRTQLPALQVACSRSPGRHTFSCVDFPLRIFAVASTCMVQRRSDPYTLGTGQPGD